MIRRGTSSSNSNNRGVRRITLDRILTLTRILGFEWVAKRKRKVKLEAKTLCKKTMEMIILLTTAILTTIIIMKAMILVVLKLLLEKMFWILKLERGALGNQLHAA
ncbi:hypothetical protein Godav_016279 [Gossypium davidsonii]|uniref:Uncharacterized protein n=1 Tax=Gossypium davidsonii TaxID=34287 RepID=A0A7J8RRH5_GOSDV|nr:hypothetical protein [Gossypium davidsonii]